jgi:hypothetical protein
MQTDQFHVFVLDSGGYNNDKPVLVFPRRWLTGFAIVFEVWDHIPFNFQKSHCLFRTWYYDTKHPAYQYEIGILAEGDVRGRVAETIVHKLFRELALEDIKEFVPEAYKEIKEMTARLKVQ